jgi:hypothetical protein
MCHLQMDKGNQAILLIKWEVTEPPQGRPHLFGCVFSLVFFQHVLYTQVKKIQESFGINHGL